MKALNGWLCLLLGAALLMAGCRGEGGPTSALIIPRGYVATLEIEIDGLRYGFGPFVGYYFRPINPADLTRLEFLCFNERNFYTLDQPENSRLFEGDAVLTRLPDRNFPLPASGGRIRPVYFDQAPKEWLATRPEPQDEYVHFHSLHNAAGPALLGYWLRHRAVTAFTYDMGGRIGSNGPLYHRVAPGTDREFAHLIEFDWGPHYGAD